MGVFNYSCEICGRGYTSRTSLHGHMSSKHGIQMDSSLIGTRETISYITPEGSQQGMNKGPGENREQREST